MIGSDSTTDHQQTWRQVIALLVEAADRGYEQAARDPGIHSVALGADSVASSAIALLPPEVDDELDDITLDPGTDSLTVGGLIRAAEQTARRIPIEQLPPGASDVIVDLGQLADQADA